MKRKWKDFIATGATVLALGGFIKWLDPAIVYHTFPPTLAQHRVIKGSNGTTFTPKQLEEKLGVEIRGEFTDDGLASFKHTTESLKQEAPQLFSNTKRIIAIPLEYDLPYGGVAIGKKIALSATDRATIVHELAHTYSFSLPDSFWEEWKSISQGHYRDIVPGSTYMRNRLKHAGILKGGDGIFAPKHGILTEYGQSNPHEDLAEFVEAVYDDNKGLMHVDPKEAHLYEKKIALLRDAGFITGQRAQEALDNVALGSDEGLARFVTRYGDDIPMAAPIRFNPYGMTLYESKDKKLHISYGAFRDAPRLHISVMANQPGNSKSIFVPPRDPAQGMSGIPKTLLALLEKKGYLDIGSMYYIEKVYASTDESLESIAERRGVAVAELHGPVPMFDFYSESSTPAYYVRREVPSPMTVFSNTP